jgi:RND family efflux transporter MFP subunit
MARFWCSAVRAAAGLGALLGCLNLAACAPARAGAPEARTTPVEAVTVAAPSDEAVLGVSGVIRRQRESALSFPVGGVLRDLRVDAGDRLARGQLLASLDATPFQARLSQAAAELDRARRDRERYEALAAQGFVSARLIESLRTVEVQARSAYDSAAFEARSARLVSPVSGAVTARVAQAGEVMQPGQTVITVADSASGFVLRAPLSDRDVARVRLGSSAEVRLDGLPGTVLAGRVSRIGEAADIRSATVMADISVPEAAGLRTGMVGLARIAVVPARPAFGAPLYRAPAEAILETNGGRATVYRVERGVARRMAVTFGGFDGDHALIGGVPPGAQLITAGAGFVSDGDRVAVTSRPGAGLARAQP